MKHLAHGTGRIQEASTQVEARDIAQEAAHAEEAEIVRRCQDGDREAFRFIVERYGSMLHGTAYLMTRNHAIAEELSQEALILAWRGIKGFKGGSLKAWLAKILVNKSVSQSRRKDFGALDIDDPSTPQPTAGEGQDPASATLTIMEQERVRAALETLPEDQREVVTLRFFSELSVAETAAALGVREGTVKSRLSRALERLRGVLVEDID